MTKTRDDFTKSHAALIIKSSRLALGISQQQAAGYANMSVRTLCRIESGQRALKREEAQYLATLLQCSADALIS